MPLDKSIKKVLVIGSGPIVIGQAAEFDYAGTQACRVLKSEGINVVLVNSNPATIMTDKTLADEIYLEPLKEETIKRIILKEKPDSILAGLGGQTGLTVAMQLSHSGFLAKHNVRLLGTKADSIDKAEDRELFKETMMSIGEPVIPSDITSDADEALRIAERIGYPVIVRPAFTLGGAGGGYAYGPEELYKIARDGIFISPIHQILVEKYIFGWKEIEFEVMRDANDNCISICSMENVDSVGIHTGDSIVAAPALTLADREFDMLRRASLKIISALGIEGGCNCQFALDPKSFEYAVIEVNPRVSRSSALASKATGYPIAKVTAKIALGYTLDEISNDVTGKTSACFEPTVDYVVVKFPKWPFDKFKNAGHTLGTQMKATGEVMAIGTNFEAALMKAIRGAEISLDTPEMPGLTGLSDAELENRLHEISDTRVFTIYEALRRGVSPEKIESVTRIDKFFIYKIKNLVLLSEELKNKKLDFELYKKAKTFGFTDSAIERLNGEKLAFRLDAAYKTVDTCAAEFDAETPYYYSTYDDVCEARERVKDKKRETVLVLGSGPIRIGQGIEFDYSSVHCVMTLKKLGFDVAVINNNPETVSTDFDISDRLYFEPLTPEDVMNVIKIENPVGVVVAFGGQTAIKLVDFLSKSGINILGTSAESIDIAEDREKFDELLERIGMKRPKGAAVLTLEEALETSAELGYPVLLRPSYVIGGQNMVIAYDRDDVERYMNIILERGISSPVLVDKYMMGTELDVDAISDGEDVLIPGIMEHIERAGVHSGDSIAVYPPYNLGDAMLDTITRRSIELARSLKTKGLINIQYLIYKNELYVIEVNPRASRTIPYISKVTGVPMVDIATRIMFGEKLRDMGYETGLYKTPPYFSVKVPVFSFRKIPDANSALGPEMKSTGEVLGIGRTLSEALYKGLVSAGFDITHPSVKREKSGVFITVNKSDQFEVVRLAKKFVDLGMDIYATKGTGKMISSLGTDVRIVDRLSDSDDILRLIDEGKIQYIIYTGSNETRAVKDFIRLHSKALQKFICCLTSLDTANALADILASRFNEGNTELCNICSLRTERQKLRFSKMCGSGDDYIFFDNFGGAISCPEAMAVTFTDRHYGIGGDGLVLIEGSDVADARMRIFNQDGSEGKTAGNCIRCVGKYLYDNGIVSKDEISIETAGGIKKLRLYTTQGKVSSVRVDMGKAEFRPDLIPVKLPGDRIIGREAVIDGKKYDITCLSVGNPHCVVFCDDVDAVDVPSVGPMFENDPMFPERINTEFVRVINETTIKMRVWERGNGETMACGTGACAAVAAAVENGLCAKGEDVLVKLRGGDLVVNYTDDGILLTGNASLIYEGVVEY